MSVTMAEVAKHNTDGDCWADTEQKVVLIRHAKSKANEWKEANGDANIDANIAQQYGLFNAPLSVAGLQAVEKHRNDLWRHIHWVAGERDIRIFCSPIKRALQTCLVSLDCEGAAPLFKEKGKVKVSPIAMVMETGNSCENEGILEATIKQDTDFDKELHGQHIGNEIMDWSHFYDGQKIKPPNPEWWDKDYRNNIEQRVKEFNKLLKYRAKHWGNKPPKGECIVVFSHWGFTLGLAGTGDMKNFGTDTEKEDSKLHKKAIMEKLGPDQKWTWWRESGEYESKLAPLPHA